MNYKDINDKWKVFLTENTFKEDKVIPSKKKKRHKDKKKLITSENETEELDEMSGAGAVAGYSGPIKDEEPA